MKLLTNFFGVLLFFVLVGTNLSAQILSNGTGGGDWNTSSTWTGGVIPTVTDSVIVQTGDVVTLASQGECASLVLQAGTTLSLNASSLVVPGSAWYFDVTSTVIYNGTTTIQSGPVYGNLTYATTSNGGPNGDLTINGNLTITGSTVRGISDVTGTRTHTVAGDVLLSGTGSRITAVNSGSATDASCTWNIGGNVSLTAANSGNRIILYESGGPHSGSAVFNIDGNLSLTASSQIMLKSSSSTSSDFPEGIINLKGNLVQDGRIGINSAVSGTSPGLTINFNGTSLQDWSNSGTGDFAISAFVVTLNVDNPAGVTISFAASMPDRTVLKSTNGDFTPLDSLVFNDGSIYEHAQNAGAIPLATWDTGSTCLITGVVADRPTNTNQNFYNFIWNCPAQTGNEEVRWSGNTIGGDVTCVSSGGSQFRFTSSTEYTDSITILGNVNVLDGTLTSTGSSTAMSYLIIVHGDINITGGTFRLTAASGAAVNWRLLGDLNVTNAELRSSGSASKFIFDGDALIDTQRVAFTSATYNGIWDYEIGSTAIVRIVDGPDSIDVQVSGNFINGGDIVADGWVEFLSGSNYQHIVNSATVPNGIWDTGSTATFTGITTQAPANRNQSYYNIVWNCPGQVSNLNMGFDEVIIGGDINVISTGASNRWYLCGPVGGDSVVVTINGNIIQTGGQFSSQGTGNGLTMVEVTVLGNITVTGGNFACTRGSQGGTGTTNWYLYGENFSMSDATTQNSNTNDAKFLFSGTAQQNLTLTNVTFSSGFPVEVATGAILDVGVSQIYSSGIFTVNDGATLQTANVGGLDSLLQTSGTKTLSPAGNYTYNGTSAQITGGLLPATVNDLTIDNIAGATLSNDITVNGTLAVNSGNLHLDGKIVTLGSSAMLTETPGNTVTDLTGKIVTTRNLNAPTALNVAGMGAMLTTAADLGSTTIERYHYSAMEGSNNGIFRVFNIVPTNNTTLDATLRYYYDESELNGAGESGLELYKSPDGTNNTWVLQGGTVNTTDNYVELSAIGSFSYWTLFGEATNTFQLTVNVNDGWNIVSVPGINPDGQGVEFWWPGRTGDVYRYNAGYQVITTTTPGEGYWMKNVGAQTYNTGDEWPAGGIQFVAHDPIPGVAGWNLIGGYENSATVANITTNPSGLQEGPVYGFSGGYTTPATMEPGYGYWIKLSGAGDIILPSSLAKGTEPVEWFNEDWGRIVVIDAEGKTYTLYAVDGEVNLDNYELPPLPPQGMFDIRYGSGRIAEDINSSVQGIDMQGITYPLTVRVENMDIRIQDETGKKLNENVKDGEEIVISNATISKLMVSGELLPTVYALEQNYPNPFNPSTTIEFSLPEASNVTLTIYNMLGQRITELVNTKLDIGRYSYQWNARSVATGMYIYELKTDKFSSIKKMMLVK